MGFPVQMNPWIREQKEERCVMEKSLPKYWERWRWNVAYHYTSYGKVALSVRYYRH
jgi:hypothetical protein